MSIFSPKILEGPSFDWEEGNRYSKRAVDEDGNVNWQAAAFADPGVTRCRNPACGVYLWNEGWVIECPKCGHVQDLRKPRTPAPEDGHD